MRLVISNSANGKLRLLTLTLLIEYCGSLYLALSSNIFGQFVSTLMLGMSLLTAVLYIYFNRRKRHIIFWSLCYVLCFICYRACRRREILDLFTMVSFYSDVDYKALSRKILRVTACFLGVTAVLSLVRILPMAPTFYRGSVIRHTFGLNHPNAVGYFTMIIAEMLFIQNYRIRSQRVWFWLAILTFIPFYLSNSRTAFIVVLLLLILYTLRLVGFNSLNIITRLKAMKTVYLVFIGVIVAGLVYVSFNYEGFQFLNKVMSARLENNYLFLQTYKIRLFGNADVPRFLVWYDGWGARYLDSGFMQLLIIFGLINTVIYVWLFYKAISNSIKDGRGEIAVVLVLIACVLLVEASPLHWYIASPILFQCKSIFGNKPCEVKYT